MTMSPPTVVALEEFIAANVYHTEMSELRQHHEIYLGDPSGDMSICWVV